MDIVRRDELALLDIHDAAGAPRFEQQIGLAAKERRDLQDVDHLGGGSRLRGLVDIGEDGVPIGFHAGENPQAFFQARAAETGEAGAIGLVERRFEDERPGDVADGARHEVDVLLAFDDAGTGDQGQGTAAERDRFAARVYQLNRLWMGHEVQSPREYSRTCSNEFAR